MTDDAWPWGRTTRCPCYILPVFLAPPTTTKGDTVTHLPDAGIPEPFPFGDDRNTVPDPIPGKGDGTSDLDLPQPAPPLSPEEAETVARFDAAPPLGDDTLDALTVNGGRLDDELADALPAVSDDQILDEVTAERLLDSLGRDPVELAATSARLRDTIVDVVRSRTDARRLVRKARVGDRTLTRLDLRHEIAGAADDAAALEALAGAFTIGAGEAKGSAGDLLDELPPSARTGKAPTSTKAADGHGAEITVTRSVRTETSVQHDVVDDVAVAWLLRLAELSRDQGETGGPLDLKRHPSKAYSAGARDAVALLRGLLSSSPSYRTTALDKLVAQLGNAGEDDLAGRLSGAYARVEKGEPTVKIDRKPIDTEQPAATS